MIDFRTPASMQGNLQQFAHVAFDVYDGERFVGMVRSVDMLPAPSASFVPEAPGDSYSAPASEIDKVVKNSAWLAFDGPQGRLVGRYPTRQEAGKALV